MHIDRASGMHDYSLDTKTQQTVLDALFFIQNELDETLAFRCSCRVGMCGSCGMVINGREGLACRTNLDRLGRDIYLRPLRHMRRIKDLVVDMDEFFTKYRAVDPYLKARPEVHSPIVAPPISRMREDIDVGLECISCGLCLSACDVVGVVSEFLGPAALNRAYNLIADVRDEDLDTRLGLVGQERSGVWQCHTHMSCVEVCPKNIAPTRAIAHLKRKLIARRFGLHRERLTPQQQTIIQEGR